MSRRVEQLPEEQMAIPPSEREAKAFFHRLLNRVRGFEAELSAGEELLLTSSSAPGVRILQIGKNGEAFFFSGVDSEGRDVLFVQHYTQMKVMATVVVPPKGVEPRPIGLLDRDDA